MIHFTKLFQQGITQNIINPRAEVVILNAPLGVPQGEHSVVKNLKRLFTSQILCFTQDDKLSDAFKFIIMRITRYFLLFNINVVITALL